MRQWWIYVDDICVCEYVGTNWFLVLKSFVSYWALMVRDFIVVYVYALSVSLCFMAAHKPGNYH